MTTETSEVVPQPSLRQLAREASAARGIYEKQACDLADLLITARPTLLQAQSMHGLDPALRTQLNQIIKLVDRQAVRRRAARAARKAWRDAVDAHIHQAAAKADVEVGL